MNLLIIKKYPPALAFLVFVLIFPLLWYVVPPFHNLLDNLFLKIYTYIVSSYHPSSVYANYESMEEVKDAIYSSELSFAFFVNIYEILVKLRPTAGGNNARDAMWLYCQVYGMNSAFFSIPYFWLTRKKFSQERWAIIFPVFFHGWGIIFSSILLIILYKQRKGK